MGRPARIAGNTPFLLGDSPVYADYALFGVLGNLTYTGDNEIPSTLTHIRRWHERLTAHRLQARS